MLVPIPQAPAPAPRPPRTTKRNVIFALGVVAAVYGGIWLAIWLGGVLFDRADVGDFRPAPAAETYVDITGCGTTDAGNFEANIRVTNSTTRTRDYRITVGFYDSSGTQLETGFATILDLAPAQSAIDDVIGFGDGPAARCRVTDVSRI